MVGVISSLGVGSGLDLRALVDGLINAERIPVESRLQFNRTSATTQLSAFGALRSSLSLFQGSLSDLKFSSTYNSKQAALSDNSVFSVSVSSTAYTGSYSVEVTEIARSQSLASNAGTAFTSITDTVGTGTMIVKFGTTGTGPYSFTEDNSKATQTIVVSVANNNNTLTGLRDYINNNDYGFKAAIINDGDGYRMVFTSDDSGVKNSMEITVTDDDAGNNDNSGLSQFAFNASAQTGMSQTVSAKDAALVINGLTITRETNTVTGAIDGVTLNLLKADVGNTVSVNITENSAAARSAIEAFIGGYNGLIASVNLLTRYDADSQGAGVLLGDFTVRSITSQLRNLITDRDSSLSGEIRSLADLGITTQSDGTLTLDDAKLDIALSKYASQVEALFIKQGRPSDSGIEYLTASSVNTLAGNYAVIVDAMATQGVFNGSLVNNLLTVNADNDEFTIRVNGTPSGSIALIQSVYADGDALAAHIQAQINADASLKSAGASVSVVYDSVNNEFDVSSSRYGSLSSIEFIVVDTNTSDDFGFSVASGTAGTNVSGTINGYSANGDGQILTSTAGASDGLSLLISSGSAGSRGTVAYSRGMIDKLDQLLNSFINANGYINSREEGLNDKLEKITEEFEKLNNKLTILETRLIKRFSVLDGLIAQMKSTSSFLTLQLANLPEPNSIGRRRR